MKILWILHSSGLTGAERSALEGTKSLIEQGIETEVVFPSEGPLLTIVREMGIKTFILPHHWWVSDMPQRLKVRLRNILKNVFSARRFAVILQERNVDLVISSTVTSPFGAFLARFAKIPHIWFLEEFGKADHGFDFVFGDKLSSLIMKNLTTQFIVNSEAVRSHYGRWFTRKKISLIDYAVEVLELPLPDYQANVAGSVFHLIVVGTMIPGKRQEDAIRAIDEVKKRGLDVKLSLLGHDSGQYADYLKDLAQHLGVSKYVEFLSFSKKPFQVMAAADVLVVCSRCEAFGRVTVEAMKLGIPVIGSASGGTPELIRNGFNGLLYSPCDYLDLADKVEYLILNRHKIEEMGRNARIWARERFTLERYRASLSEIVSQAFHDYKHSAQNSVRG
ncbi:MAG: glycosyltransferase family 4 protein [Geobacteraceae bacterium]|nr:glycosyltransferase family 4 protein [Geobacteraceae bacterium]